MAFYHVHLSLRGYSYPCRSILALITNLDARYPIRYQISQSSQLVVKAVCFHDFVVIDVELAGGSALANLLRHPSLLGSMYLAVVKITYLSVYAALTVLHPPLHIIRDRPSMSQEHHDAIYNSNNQDDTNNHQHGTSNRYSRETHYTRLANPITTYIR
jgi:hypothetical protein